MKKIVASLVSVAAFCAFAELPQPYGYWKMDEMTVERKIPDVSGNGLEMTVGEGVSLVEDERFGKVARWEGVGGSWGKFSNPALSNRTISIWFKRDASDADFNTADNNKLPYLFANWSNFYVNFGKNTPGFNAYLGGNSYYTIVAPSRSVWHQLVIAVGDARWYDEAKTNFVATLSVYLDGVQTKKYENIVTSKSILYKSDFVLGNHVTDSNHSTPRPFKGEFAEIRVWDVTLSENDIRKLYLEDTAALAPRLTGFWPLSEIVDNGSEREFAAVGNALTPLVCQANVKVVADDDMGCGVAEFPNYTLGSYANFTLPEDANGFSFGMWLKYPTNMLDLAEAGSIDNAAKTNTMPNVYSFGNYSRLCIEGGYRSASSVGGHFFDVASRDNAGDQGFHANTVPVITQKGRWGHFGMTFKISVDDASGLYALTPRIYVDGVCVLTGRTQTAAKLANVIPQGTSFMLGSSSVDSPRSFCGRMADFAVYSGPLSDDAMADLASGMPEVDAGDDFTLAAGVRGRLSASVSPFGKMGNRRAAKTKLEWTLVSCPEGGESAEILMKNCPEALISLPVAGEYVFRLTARSDRLKIAVVDEVTVTCVPAADNAAPSVSVTGKNTVATRTPLSFAASVSDADSAPGSVSVRWKYISGPGAVSFEPAAGTGTEAIFHAPGEYKIAAVAFDGQSEAESGHFSVVVEGEGDVGLDAGLIAYWPFDAGCWDSVSGTKYTVDRVAQTFENGISGYGVRCNGAFYPYLNTGMTLLETTSDKDYQMPDERYRAFSLWMYHDPSDTNNSSRATIVSVPYSLGLWYNCENGVNGFTMYQQTLSPNIAGQGNCDVYARPERDPAGRWTHVYALFDRKTGRADNTSELWIDGVRQTSRTVNGMGGGRVRSADTIMIGGHKANGDGNNGHFKDGSGNYLSRTFPGVIDEVRMYNRRLTEAEIKYLAANPVADIDRAPAVSAASKARRVGTRKEAAIAAAAGDDRKAAAELTGRWQVVGGDAASVSFADAAAAETEFTAAAAGVYLLSYVVSDGENETWSEPVEINVTRSGMTVTVR